MWLLSHSCPSSATRATAMAMHVVGLVLGMILCTQVLSVNGRSTSVFTASVNQLRHGQHHGEGVHPHLRPHSRKLSSLVETSPLLLSYHNGPILASDSDIHIYIIWYGLFSESEQATIVDFFGSFSQGVEAGEPSVRSWWKVTESYRDSSGAAVSSEVRLKGEVFDSYSKGKTLSKQDVQDLVELSLTSGAFPADSKSIYYVLTADDVEVGTFCMNTCGSHHVTTPTGATKYQQLPYAWVGNAGKKCPGRCAWPFAKPQYGPQSDPLVAPNGDVGVDGMIINIAAVLAGTATNPFNNAFFQGDTSAPLESATACTGIYGEGAFPGYPGALLVDQTSGASYNAVGLNGREFLLPVLYDPATLSCRVAHTLAIDVAVMDKATSRIDSQ